MPGHLVVRCYRYALLALLYVLYFTRIYLGARKWVLLGITASIDGLRGPRRSIIEMLVCNAIIDPVRFMAVIVRYSALQLAAVDIPSPTGRYDAGTKRNRQIMASRLSWDLKLQD